MENYYLFGKERIAKLAEKGAVGKNQLIEDLLEQIYIKVRR